jgi:hypothetical protein
VATAALILLQIRVDHDRRRRQATIEFFHSSIRPVWRDSLRQIRERWGRGPLSEQAVAEVLGDPKANDLVVNLLDNLEIMAVAVHTGIYDKETIVRLAGALLAGVRKKLDRFIERKQKENATQFCEFCKLADECQKRLEGGDKE